MKSGLIRYMGSQLRGAVGKVGFGVFVRGDFQKMSVGPFLNQTPL